VKKEQAKYLSFPITHLIKWSVTCITEQTIPLPYLGYSLLPLNKILDVQSLRFDTCWFSASTKFSQKGLIEYYILFFIVGAMIECHPKIRARNGGSSI